MAGIRFVDVNGKDLPTISRDQGFRIHLDTGSTDGPKTIDVKFVWDDGDDTDTFTITKMADGTYSSTIVTARAGGKGAGSVGAGGYRWATGNAGRLDVASGKYLTVTHGDHADRVKVFDTYVQQGIHLNRLFMVQTRDYYTNLAIKLTHVLRALNKIGKRKLNAEGKRIYALALEGKRIANHGFSMTGRALRQIDNDRLLDPQRFHISNWYVNRLKGDFDPKLTKAKSYTHSLRDYDKRNEWESVQNASARGRQQSEDALWKGLTEATIGAYRLLANATGAAQMMTLFGTTEMGKKAKDWEKIVALFDLVGQASMMSAMTTFNVSHTVGRTHSRVHRRQAAANPETAATGTRIEPTTAGITDAAAAQAQRVARKHGVHILTRQSGRGVAELRTQGFSPKPMEIKAKTINELDVHLGAPSSGLRQVGFFEPKMPKSRPAGMDDASWKALGERFSQRQAEFNGPTGQKMRALEGKGVIELRNGVCHDTGLVTGSGKPITGDYDLFEIVFPTGAPVPKHVYNAVVADLTAGPFQAMHGAHMRWDIQLGEYSTFAQFAHAADVIDTNLSIYNKIVRGHHTEPLVAFGGDRPPYALMSDATPPFKLGDIGRLRRRHRPTTDPSIVNPTTHLRYASLTFLDPDEAKQLQLADKNWAVVAQSLLDQIDVLEEPRTPRLVAPSGGFRGLLSTRRRRVLGGLAVAATFLFGGLVLRNGPPDGGLPVAPGDAADVPTQPLIVPDDATGSDGDTGLAGADPVVAPDQPATELVPDEPLTPDVGVDEPLADDLLPPWASSGPPSPADLAAERFDNMFGPVLTADGFGAIPGREVVVIDNDTVLFSDGTKSGQPDQWARFDSFTMASVDLSAGQVDDIFGTGGPLACDATFHGRVVECPLGTGSPAPGTMTIFRFDAAGDFPTTTGPYVTQVGLAVSTQGGEKTGFTNPQFTSDFFTDANAWLSIDIDKNGDLIVTAIDVDGPAGANLLTPIDDLRLRLVRGNDVIDVLVPGSGPFSELTQARGSLFKHTGDFSLNGGPWAGDLTSTIEDGMRTVPVALPLGPGVVSGSTIQPIAEFADHLSTIFESNNVEAAIELLDPLVLDRWSRGECEQSLTQSLPVTGPFTVVDHHGPERWEWDARGQTVVVENAYTATVERASDGELITHESHFGVGPDGALTFFTFCE